MARAMQRAHHGVHRSDEQGASGRVALVLLDLLVRCGFHGVRLSDCGLGDAMEWILTRLFNKHNKNLPLNGRFYFLLVFMCIWRDATSTMATPL
jgi:hypothetical protein